MSLEKTLKRATRKNVFMAPCVMFPYARPEVGRKRNWHTFLLPTALPICHSGLQGKEGLEEGRGLGEKRENAKGQRELRTNPLLHLASASWHWVLTTWGYSDLLICVTLLLDCLRSLFLPYLFLYPLNLKECLLDNRCSINVKRMEFCIGATLLKTKARRIKKKKRNILLVLLLCCLYHVL